MTIIKGRQWNERQWNNIRLCNCMCVVCKSVSTFACVSYKFQNKFDSVL